MILDLFLVVLLFSPQLSAMESDDGSDWSVSTEFLIELEEYVDEHSLWGAARNNDVARLQELAAQEVDMTARDELGRKALHYAAWHGATEAVQELLQYDNGIDEPTETHGWAPLHLAAFFRREDVVSVLLAKQANVFARTKRGSIPLEKASVDSIKNELRSAMEAVVERQYCFTCCKDGDDFEDILVQLQSIPCTFYHPSFVCADCYIKMDKDKRCAFCREKSKRDFYVVRRRKRRRRIKAKE